MPIVKAPLTESEMALFEIVSTPSVFGEFVRSSPHDPADKQWRNWPQQIREMNREEPHKKRFQGRNLGKTITCMDELNSAVLLYDGVEDGLALIGTRAEPNLQPIFKAMAALWEYNRFLKHFLLKDVKRAIDRKNKEIRLFHGNRMTIKGRIQGKDGQGFNTVHPNVIAWVDEAQYIDQLAIAEFYGMISGELPLIASGVPNGWRMSWAYQIDTDPKWGFVGGKMTRLEDPRALLDPDWIANLERTYGGRESNLFKQKVLGEWGTASSMTFNIDMIKFDYEDALPAYYRTAILDFGNYKSELDLPGILALGPWAPTENISDVIIHADHGGIGSPTTAYVSWLDKKQGAWRQYMRVLMFEQPHYEQLKAFSYIADEIRRLTKIKPTIALDTTNLGGEALATELQRLKYDVFKAQLATKVKFGTRPERQDEINKRLEKDPWDDPNPKDIDNERVLKQVAIPHLIKEMYAKTLWVVNDDDIKGQLTATSNHERANGDMAYETDYTKDESPMYDHDLQAFEVLGAVLQQREFVVRPIEAPELWSVPVDIGWGNDDPYEPYQNGLEW